MVKHQNLSTLGRKEFTSLTPSKSELIILTQSRNLEAGADAETAEEEYLLAHSSVIAQPAFL